MLSAWYCQVDDTGRVGDVLMLESWLGPYLSVESVGGVRYVSGLPASEALTAVSVDPVCDLGPFDGLPGVAMLAKAALAADPDALLSGMLVDADRPDARLHLDTVTVSGDRSAAEVLDALASVIQEGSGLDPSSIERAVDGRWVLWWD